jgi:carbon storage regulator
MLVLTRKRTEKIVIPGHNVVIEVVEVRGRQVRLAVSAPPEVRIYRAEVHERIVRKEADRCALRSDA